CAAAAGIGRDRSGAGEAPRESCPQVAEDLSPALQIERWLLFGLWPAEIEAPEDTALYRWLEVQTDADWLHGVERCGAQDQAIRRMARLSPEFVLRIAALLSGPNAEPVHELLVALHAIGRPLEGSFPPPWEEQVNRFALALLIQGAPAERRSPAFQRHLAQSTLVALSLTFQISCERLLLLLRHECEGPSSLQDLCASLVDEFGSSEQPASSGLHLEASTTDADGSRIAVDPAPKYRRGAPLFSAHFAEKGGNEETLIAGRINKTGIAGHGTNGSEVGSSEIVMGYLLGGRLPLDAPGISFEACQRIARRLTGSELALIAQACCKGQGDEILRRAESLLAPEEFRQLRQLSSSLDRIQREERAGASPRQRESESERRYGILELQAVRPRLERRADSESGSSSEARHPRIESSPVRREDLSGQTMRLLRRLDAFVFYLRSGAIPWWGDHEISGPSSEWIEPLLKDAPENLLHTLRSAASSPCAIERLLRYVPRDSIAALIRQAEPGFGGLLVHYLYFGEELKNDATLSAAQRSSAPAAHWRAALQLILDPHQPRRPFADTLTYLSGPISQQLGMTAGRYWKSLANIAQLHIQEGSGIATLAGILLQLEKTGKSHADSGRDHIFAQDGRRTSPTAEIAELPLATHADDNDGSTAQSPQRLDHKDRTSEEAIIPAPHDVNREQRTDLIFPASGATEVQTGAVEKSSPDHEPASIASGADAPMLSRHSSDSVVDNENVVAGPSGSSRLSPGEKARDLTIANTLDTAAKTSHKDEAGSEPLIDFEAEPASGNGKLLEETSAGSTEIQPRFQNQIPDAIRDRRPDRPAGPTEIAEEAAPFVPNQDTASGKLEYLMRFGILPDSSSAASLDKFMHTVAEDIGRNPETYRRLIKRSAHGAMERRRMVRNFSPEVLEAVLKLLLPNDHAVARLCMEELAEAASSTSTAKRREVFHQLCGEELIESSILDSGKECEIASYLRRALLRLAEDRGLKTAEVVRDLRRRFSRQHEPLRTRLNKALEQAERETARIPNWLRPPVPEASALRLPTTPLAQRRPERPASQLPAGEPFYIANAGAILLWPFLGRYFQTLDLTEKNAFRDETARSRAIYLVQYLVTGVAEAPEPALLLNKILCGAPPEEPVDPPPEISEEETALSLQMLQGVIANWGKLGNTSIEGLRESFLIREGRLVRKESDSSWELTVSVKAYDVLLDALPWRLSMIRLPWMQSLLHGKWR
ncbi:MAG TPA: contractile injection system tape measure protein, partial [Terracidiphilus sp.]